MTIKDFLSLKIGEPVMIKKRKAKLVSNPWVSPSNNYHAGFQYLDTGRKVYKNNRQVKKISGD